MKIAVNKETKLKSFGRTYLHSDQEVMGAKRDLVWSFIGFGIVFVVLFILAVVTVFAV